MLHLTDSIFLLLPEFLFLLEMRVLALHIFPDRQNVEILLALDRQDVIVRVFVERVFDYFLRDEDGDGLHIAYRYYYDDDVTD